MTRIGLTQRVAVVDEYGERRDCLDQRWTAFLRTFGCVPVPLPNTVCEVETYLRGARLDGVILTSGNDLAHLDDPDVPAPERDRFERRIIEYATDEGLPLLGVCRGLQLLNVHFGGKLTPVDGHVDRPHSLAPSGPGAPFDVPEPATVNSFHDYGIDRDDVAAELDVYGTAPDGTVELTVHAELPLCGVMWHPERNDQPTELDRRLIEHLFGADA